MSSKVTVAMVGIGGYGDKYLNALLDRPKEDGFRIIGVVDPEPQRSRHLLAIQSAGIPIYSDLEALYSRERPDLVMMATPIHLHAVHTCFALSKGSNVLCEKPAGATIEDARKMLAAEDAASHLPGDGRWEMGDGIGSRNTATSHLPSPISHSRRFAAIGYQWSFSRAIQKLKHDIIAGDFGRPIRLKTLVCHPRPEAYFRRNDWAGRIRTDDGVPVYDSPANNATSHFLHNMLFVLGPQPQLSATPVQVQAELYRANDIENYDTAAIRCITDGGAELLFYTTHAARLPLGPILHYEFEKAVICFEVETHGGFIARFRDGSVRRYGDPNSDRYLKIWWCIEAVRGSQSRVSDIRLPIADLKSRDRQSAIGDHVPCTVRSAIAHTLCVSGAQASMPEVRSFPRELIVAERTGDGPMRSVAGLGAALVQCYDQAILPAEHGGIGWSAAGRTIDLSGPQWSINGQPPPAKPKPVLERLAVRQPVT